MKLFPQNPNHNYCDRISSPVSKINTYSVPCWVGRICSSPPPAINLRIIWCWYFSQSQHVTFYVFLQLQNIPRSYLTLLPNWHHARETIYMICTSSHKPETTLLAIECRTTFSECWLIPSYLVVVLFHGIDIRWLEARQRARRHPSSSRFHGQHLLRHRIWLSYD